MAFVRIEHQYIEGAGLVSERAYLRVHKGNGWQLADEQPTQPVNRDDEPKRPQRNDTTESWRTYAVSRGMARGNADQMTRDGDDGLIAYFDTLDQTQES